MKSILVYDSTSSRSDAHCRALVGLGYFVWHYSNGSISSFPPNKWARPASYDFIFLHANDPFDEASNTGPILRYGGKAVIAPGRVPRSVSPPDAMLTIAEMTAFFGLVFSTPPTPLDDAIKIVWRNNESEFAFRLLCEAWEQVEIKKQSKLHEITIHSPSDDAKNWFKPFEFEPSVDNAKKIAALMGTNQERAKAVLLAVVNKELLADPIEAFLHPKATDVACTRTTTEAQSSTDS